MDFPRTTGVDPNAPNVHPGLCSLRDGFVVGDEQFACRRLGVTWSDVFLTSLRTGIGQAIIGRC